LILALFENVVLLMMSYMNFDFLPKCKLKKIIFILNKYLYN
jgi:hypothetical protein